MPGPVRPDAEHAPHLTVGTCSVRRADVGCCYEMSSLTWGGGCACLAQGSRAPSISRMFSIHRVGCGPEADTSVRLGTPQTHS